MSTVHAVSAGHAATAGRCAWRWHWEDVDLRCESNPIPGGTLCAEHLIEKTGRHAVPRRRRRK